MRRMRKSMCQVLEAAHRAFAASLLLVHERTRKI